MLSFLLAMLACTAPPELQGRWVRADLHVHSSLGSNDTDGLGLPAALPEAMARANLDVVFLTDHSNSQGSMDCADVEDCPNRGPERTDGDWPEGVYLASEISPIHELPSSTEPTGHIGCLARDGFATTFVDRPPGSMSGADAVDACRDAGGFAVLNHPFGPAAWVAFDWTSEDFDAIEVFNGGLNFDPTDAEALQAWEDRVAIGRDIVPVGGSDCHRWGTEAPGTLLDPALGWPTTHVLLREGEDVMDGLRAGRVWLGDPITTLAFTATRGRTIAGPGESLRGPATAHVHAISAAEGLVLQLKQVGGPVVAEAPVRGEARLEFTLSPGLYYSRIMPEDPVIAGSRGVAVSHMIRVE